MARPLRIEFPGAFYHVMARGNEKQSIYRDCRDRDKFLKYLETAKERYQAVIHCYCLMDNHYHLLLETPAGNLSQIMRFIKNKIRFGKPAAIGCNQSEYFLVFLLELFRVNTGNMRPVIIGRTTDNHCSFNHFSE